MNVDTVMCLADGCSHSTPHSNCKFFQLPNDHCEQQVWLRLVRGNSLNKSEVFLCSCHFPNGNRELMPNVPSEPDKVTNNNLDLNGIQEKVCNINLDLNEIQDPLVTSADEQVLKRLAQKRADYLDWEEYFMTTALLAAKRSKDPVTQVGACIVNRDKKIVGIGYNGMPWGCSDDQFPWGKSDNLLKSKHGFVVHAELNAVLNSNSLDVAGCTVYVCLFPCNECAKVLIQSKITEVVYLSDKHASKCSTVAAKEMFRAAGVKFRQFVPRRKQIIIEFDEV